VNPCEPIEVASLPGDDLTIPFDVLGCNAEVLCEFSEIDPDFVDLNNGFLSVEAVLPGECATLIYETCVCDEKVIVAHLFIRDPVDPASQPSADSLFLQRLLLQLLSPLLSLILASSRS